LLDAEVINEPKTNWVGWSGSMTPYQPFAPAGRTKRNAAPSAISHLCAISLTPADGNIRAEAHLLGMGSPRLIVA
jgi:hypothetical protein